MKNLSLPIYQRIYDEILHHIINDHYKIGSNLPSEAELERIYQVSRTPIRQALNELEINGYIVRSKGRKSVVKSKTPQNSWATMTGLQHNYREEDLKSISATTVELSVIEDKEIAKKLGLYLSNEVIHLKRLRRYHDEPVLYGEHYIHPIIPISIFEENTKALSVSEILIKEKQIKVTQVKEEIEAILADGKLSGYLGVSIGSPLLKVNRNSYTPEGQLIDINQYYVRTDKWKYEVSFEL